MEKLGERIAPVAYDIRSYASLGLLHKLIEGIDADAPGRIDLDRVRAELVYAVADARAGASDLACRLTSPAARKTRAASIEVRRRLAQQWRSAEPGDVRA
jgi:malonate decarboxylase gamma subunit